MKMKLCSEEKREYADKIHSTFVTMLNIIILHHLSSVVIEYFHIKIYIQYNTRALTYAHIHINCIMNKFFS